MKANTHYKAIFATTSLLLAGPAALAAEPETAPEDTWVSVSGKVTEVNPQAFELDHDSGKITVEFDDWDSDADAYKLVVGDKVTVTGKIDTGLYEDRTIEGSSVYVDSVNTYYYASAADEEGDWENWNSFVTITPIEGASTVLQGVVTAVMPDEDKFEISSGVMLLTVETEEMSYDPLDDEGYQQIEVGDRVSVSGEFNDEFFDGKVLEADTIITLSDNG
jgi:uncharacterized protein YdeI (BOF family)